MAIMSSGLTKLPNDGTIRGADTNRSIGYITDRWRNGGVFTQGGRQQKNKKEGVKQKRNEVNKSTQTNKPCFVQPAVTAGF